MAPPVNKVHAIRLVANVDFGFRAVPLWFLMWQDEAGGSGQRKLRLMPSVSAQSYDHITIYRARTLAFLSGATHHRALKKQSRYSTKYG